MLWLKKTCDCEFSKSVYPSQTCLSSIFHNQQTALIFNIFANFCCIILAILIVVVLYKHFCSI